MGKFEVTQGQWKAVMGSNPSRVQGMRRQLPGGAGELERHSGIHPASSTREAARPTGWPAKPNGNTQPGRAAPGGMEFWRPANTPVGGPYWLVQRQQWKSTQQQCRPEEAQRLWLTRHAWQRVGMGARLLARQLQRCAHRWQRLDDQLHRKQARAPWRLLERQSRRTCARPTATGTRRTSGIGVHRLPACQDGFLSLASLLFTPWGSGGR
jgi:hypothetical protein